MKKIKDEHLSRIELEKNKNNFNSNNFSLKFKFYIISLIMIYFRLYFDVYCSIPWPIFNMVNI